MAIEILGGKDKNRKLKPCRLLYVVGQLGLGGLERQLCYLLRCLNRSRYLPAVVAWHSTSDDQYAHEIKALGVPLYIFPPSASGFAKLRALHCFARQLRPEVIHSYSFYTNFAAYWAAFGTSAIAVGSIRGDFYQAKKCSGPVLGRLSARWPRCHISNNLASAEQARRSRGLFCPKQVVVVRNGLDTKRFYAVHNGGKPKTYLASIGSLLPLKRWDRVLRMAAEAKRRGIECLVNIAGDGPERLALEKQALELGIRDRVNLLGATLDVPKFLEGCKFLVHSSDTEGCPNAVMEAVSCGRAVVAMDVGDIRHLVEEGKTGFVVQRGDEATFINRALELLLDDDLCMRMGLAARAKAEREFGVERLAAETLEAYKAAGWSDVEFG
jgi:glycosyltransferase involved in cell wall biosynthesis